MLLWATPWASTRPCRARREAWRQYLAQAQDNCQREQCQHVYGCVLICMSHTPTQVTLKRILWSYAIQTPYAEASSAAASTSAAATWVHWSYANTPEWHAHNLSCAVHCIDWCHDHNTLDYVQTGLSPNIAAGRALQAVDHAI